VLHGLFGSLVNWRSIAKRLAATRRVISVDLRNHGRSPHAAAQSYETMADDVDELRASLAVGSSDVMGHSMGGKVAMLCALRRPDTVRRLVVVDIAPRAYPTADTAVVDALLELEPSQYDVRSEVDAALGRRIADRGLRSFLLMNLMRDDEGRFRWRINLSAIASSLGEIGAAIDAEGPFSGPTLFVRGGRSSYLVDADLESIADRFPRAQIVTVASAGHWVHVDAPDRFCDLVTSFLDR
jgi:pimeloyl-ACP methyl ester carboxylesterase